MLGCKQIHKIVLTLTPWGGGGGCKIVLKFEDFNHSCFCTVFCTDFSKHNLFLMEGFSCMYGDVATWNWLTDSGMQPSPQIRVHAYICPQEILSVAPCVHPIQKDQQSCQKR